eukprot:scaffold269471_cov36-Prasinocladus_malaysianus.AAC.5
MSRTSKSTNGEGTIRSQGWAGRTGKPRTRRNAFQGDVMHTPAALRTRGSAVRAARANDNAEGSVPVVRRWLSDEDRDPEDAVDDELCNSPEPTSFTSVSELIKYSYWSRRCSSVPKEFELTGQSFTFRAYQVWPFVYKDGGASGAYAGISIDLLEDVASASAADFSYSVVGANTSVPGRLGALQDVSLGVADATVGPITISTTKQPLQFTTPYMDTGRLASNILTPNGGRCRSVHEIPPVTVL